MAVFVLLKEVEQFGAIVVIARMVEQRLAGAWARQIHIHDLADPGARAVGHHHHAVGQQDRFVDIMGDANGGHLGARPHLHQHLLQLPPREAVEHAEGFVEQQQFRRKGEGPGDADPLFHAVGQIGGRLIHGVGQTDAGEVILNDVFAFRGGRVGVNPFDAQCDIVARGQPGKQAGRLEDDAAIGAGPIDLAVVEHDAAV